MRALVILISLNAILFSLVESSPANLKPELTKIYSGWDEELDNMINVRPVSNDICQVKVEFLSFSLAQPDSDGNCVEEHLSVSGHDAVLKVPHICGDNSGQHVFLPFDQSKEQRGIQLSIKSSYRDWKIKTTQIDCAIPMSSCSPAPSGCFQCFADRTGEVMSFNYPNQHLANLDYNICLSGTAPCTTQWGETTGVIDISAHTPYPFDGGCNAVSDILTIPGGEYLWSGTLYSVSEVCGNLEQSPYITITGTGVTPAITVFTNENEDEENAIDPTLGRMGFKLIYSTDC